MNTFGRKLTLTTFGESHTAAIGGVLDGFPAGVRIDLNFIQSELDKRKPGGSKFATARSEGDRVEILSGVFEGVSTGTPIGFIIRNENQKSGDYENLRELFRPGHADYAYYRKFGIRDHRGGGRSSARETAVRVAGGAIAQILLNEFGVSVQSGVASVGEISCGERLDFDLAARSEIFSLGNEEAMKEAILKAKQEHDSVGASVVTVIRGAPAGLGEGLYYKFDAAIAAAMMGINGVKAVEIGEGINASKMRGSQNNDSMSAAYAHVNSADSAHGVNFSRGDNSTLDDAGEQSNLNGGKFGEFKSDASENSNDSSNLKNVNLNSFSDGSFTEASENSKSDSPANFKVADVNFADGSGKISKETNGFFGSASDFCSAKNDKFGFASNHAGGTLGGMTSGQEIVIKTHFKPTPSIFLSQPTQNVRGEDVICELRGRHDPCIGVRGSVVATAMARLVTADMMLLNLSANLANLKKIYAEMSK
ncbi:chorismate synthase [Campylobacter rectus RM3267]|uniref:Chorismate synthase n=2 Tax=Campylobacter rectus TaxID=203 RepID=A0A6G5QQ84_CAMRE|nr:chorismate synthase [Campylobacter rectus]EEF12671.1 chorismate synthase [Campylobacter rectus RM3267]QCD47789.1 chorismate synthase [Campylobacter rectus]